MSLRDTGGAESPALLCICTAGPQLITALSAEIGYGEAGGEGVVFFM
jgi:hypothetical protein